MAFKRINKFQLEKAVAQLAKEKRTMPRVIGNLAKRHFRRNFREQGFVDQAKDPWQEVKRRKKGTRAWRLAAKEDPGARTRRILTGKGSTGLVTTINVQKASFDAIVVGTRGVKYAAIHNEGLEGKAWGKHKFKMPKRQFIGNSKKLEREIESYIVKELDKVFRR